MVLARRGEWGAALVFLGTGAVSPDMAPHGAAAMHSSRSNGRIVGFEIAVAGAALLPVGEACCAPRGLALWGKNGWRGHCHARMVLAFATKVKPLGMVAPK
jgi:hypothetical protein